MKELDDGEEYGWLPSTLGSYGIAETPSPPRRVHREVAPGQSMSALDWSDDWTAPVYLHGGGQNAHTWDVVIPLTGGGLALDLPGHGHSDWREDRDYRPLTSGPAVAAFLDAEGGRPRPLIGMSYGGMTAAALAATRPDLVPALVLVDILPSSGSRVRGLTPAQRGAVALMDGPAEFDTFEDMLAAAVSASPDRDLEVLTRGVRHNSQRLPSGRWRWRYDNLRDARSTESELATMWAALADPRPLMLVRGERSVFVSDEDIERLRSVNPNVRIEVAPGSGHAVQSDSPQLLSALIRDFLGP